MKQLLVFSFLLGQLSGFGQQTRKDYYGVRLSLLFSIGTHQTSFGFGLNGYLAAEYVQINLGTTYRYFIHNLGDRCDFGEWRHTLGLVAMAGKESNPINFEWDGPLHQSKRPYSLGYAHVWYRDKVGTSQRSGIWNLGIEHVDVQFENDVFAGQAKDRYRTGSLVVSYRDSMNKLSLGLQIWTGETRFSVWNRTPGYKMPSGYRDLTPNAYGNLNHGNLYLEYKNLSMHKQIVGIRAGVDSENVRHAFQNRLIHDLIWLPSTVERNTPHYPRLTEMGYNAFVKKEVRKSRPYYQVFLNDGLPY